MHKLLVIILLLISMKAFCQNGEEIFQFLNIPTSARQVGLGGNINSIYDKDPNLSLWNPALMNENMNMQLGFTYTNYLADVNYGNLSYVQQIKDDQFLSIHGRYVDYGTFTGTDEAGNITGDFTAKDAAITAGYAYNINEFFTVGTNVTYVNSSIETYKASAILADLGVTFHDYDYYNTVALTVRNVGFLIDPFEDTEEDLPLQINLGYSFKPENVPVKLTLALHDLQSWDSSDPLNENGDETGFGREVLDHISVGAELFPDKGFNLRAGYNFKRGNELAVEDARSLAGLTFGFGIRISYFKFDFGHARYHNASNVSSFGLRIDLNEWVAPRWGY